jgi:hypothetical protein
MGIPILRKGTAILRASYTTGQTNSLDVIKYNYEARLKYSFFRDLEFSAWWREEWFNGEWWAGSYPHTARYDRKTKDFGLQLYYNWRKMSFSVEYAATVLEEGPQSAEQRHLYLKLRRSL